MSGEKRLQFPAETATSLIVNNVEKSSAVHPTSNSTGIEVFGLV
jgi:hypothetical protein